MTKEELDDYIDLELEIKDLEYRIARRGSTIVSDVVSGSSPDYPYTQHPVSVHGLDECQKEKDLLAKKLEKLKKQRGEIEKFIDRLPNSRQRRIVRLRVIDGLSWREVAAKMGYRYSDQSVKKVYYRAINH